MRSEEEKKEQKRKAQKKYYEKNKEYYRKQSLEESKRVRKERNLYKNIIKEVREYIESKNNGICIQNGIEKRAYTFVLDFDEAREFIWHILEILDKENKECTNYGQENVQ